jgi:ribosomal protein L14E/L6E/L27E
VIILLIYLLLIDEFVAVFNKVYDLPIFSWVPKLVEGYQKKTMNIDDSKAADMVRRLTVISKERTKIETESMGFDSSEYDNMTEFFNKEIKKNDAKEVLKTFQKLFKDIKNSKLKRYFIESVTKHVSLIIS